MEIENTSLDVWLETLKPFQRKAIKKMLANNGDDEEKVAELWLSSFGPINTVTFGGVPTTASRKNYFQCLKGELNKLICGNDVYEIERTKILNSGNLVNVAASAKIASVIAPIIGISISVLAPALVLMLHTISKMTVNAYCSMIKQ